MLAFWVLEIEILLHLLSYNTGKVLTGFISRKQDFVKKGIVESHKSIESAKV